MGIQTGAKAAAGGGPKAPGTTTRAHDVRTTRKVARGPYVSECFDCGEAFTTQAAETRHVAATRHARYQLTLDVTPAPYAATMSNTPVEPDDEPDTPEPDTADEYGSR